MNDGGKDPHTGLVRVVCKIEVLQACKNYWQ